MALIEGKDFAVSKNAYYFGKDFMQFSGNLVITKNRILLGVIQEIRSSSEPSSIKNAVNELKKSIKAMKNYGVRKKAIDYSAKSSSGINEFENSVISMGALNPNSLDIRWDEIESYTTGIFFGLNLNLLNGTNYNIQTMKLAKIKRFIRLQHGLKSAGH